MTLALWELRLAADESVTEDCQADRLSRVEESKEGGRRNRRWHCSSE